MLTSLVWLLSLALPAGLMIANLHDHSAWREGFVLFAEQWRTSLVIAGLTAIVCLTISLAVVSFPQTDGQRPGFTSRLLGRTGGVIASLPALLPPAAVGIGLIVVYNGLGGWGDARPDSLAGKIARLFGNMYTDSPWVWSLGLVSRYAVVAILIVWLTTTKQSTTLIDQARVDGAGRLGVLTSVVLPTSWASMLAAGLIVLLLSLFEIVVTHLLAPPGYPSLSITLLNHMHYGRDDVVITTSLTALVVGIGVTQLCGWLLISSRSISRQPINLSAVTRRSVLTVLLLICATLPGCGKDRIAGRPPDDIFGDHGLGPGQFVYPRAMAVGPDGCVFVVDKTARIQRFSPSGEFEMSWRMPEWQAGKPTGVNTDATGRVLVSDTHYARVIMFDRDGNELARFGSDGTGPGQFKLPTAAVVDSDGNIYVSEYGGNDRISVFTPELEYLYSFGHITGPADAHLQRPQQLLIDKNDTLLVADAANHRICRFSLDGELVETFGQMGREPGQLSYPYDIVRSPDDMYLVAEYGNNRIQRFDRQGNSIETWGTPGRQPGELLAPWGVAMGKNNRLYVLDSGNNRIQMFRN
jgi:DNA-binding beta-propeller fold protein YncE/ABC-type spermidine/putrescine transport system permease subunit II